MVLGRGTTVITYPDGDLAAYFDSLDLLERLVRSRNVGELLPGHGPIVADPLPWLSFYRHHRRERLKEIRAALAAGDRTASEIVARVYADVDRSVWPAAEQSVRAQLDYLGHLGEREPVEARLRPFDTRALSADLVPPRQLGGTSCGLTLSQRGSVGVPFDKLGRIYCGLSLPQLDSRNAQGAHSHLTACS